MNGKSYTTTFARASCCSTATLVLGSDESFNKGHIARFGLNTESSEPVPLKPGVYTVANEGIDEIIQFIDTYSNGPHLASVIYSSKYEDGFQSGKVTVNSVSTNFNQITEIDLDYEFNWEGIEIIGNYSGAVVPD